MFLLLGLIDASGNSHHKKFRPTFQSGVPVTRVALGPKQTERDPRRKRGGNLLLDDNLFYWQECSIDRLVLVITSRSSDRR